MLYDINYHQVLKEYYDNYTSVQISSEQKSKNTENDLFFSNDESNISNSKENNYSKNEESYLPISQNNYNEYLEQSLKREDNNKKNGNNLNKVNDMEKNDKNKYIKKNISNQINDKKTNNNKITKIEEKLKKNILDGDKKGYKQYEEDQKYKTFYQKNSKNIIDKYLKKNNFGFMNQINKKNYPHTPNRILNINNGVISNNINNKKRQYSPNIAYININKNKQQEKKYLNNNEDNYENILKENLKDLDNQINLLKYGTNVNNVNDFNKNNKNSYYNNNITKSPYNNNRNDTNSNNYQSPIITHDNFYLNENTNSNDNMHNYNYKTPINYEDKSKQYDNDISNDELNNKSTNINYINNNNNNNNIINNNNLPTKFILNDLASNNSIDITRRLDNLEKSISEIKKDIASMSSMLTNLSSNNFIQNNFKEKIKQTVYEYMNEKMSSYENIKYTNIKQNNYNSNNDNRSLYSEFLNDENKQKNLFENNKKFENEINQRIDEKLENLGEEIKNHINNNVLKPSLNEIETVMKQNMDEIRKKINTINIKNNNENNYKDNINKYDNNNDNNKMLESIKSIKSSDFNSKNSSQIRNEKYEEINRLGEILYQKLMEKEQKLKLLKEETSKFLEDNDKL